MKTKQIFFLALLAGFVLFNSIDFSQETKDQKKHLMLLSQQQQNLLRKVNKFHVRRLQLKKLNPSKLNLLLEVNMVLLKKHNSM
jgi:hypothetical protein